MLMELHWATKEGVDMDGEPIPRKSLPLCQPTTNWVIHKVQEIQRYVGIECEGFEEQFIALLTAIKVGNTQLKKSV